MLALVATQQRINGYIWLYYTTLNWLKRRLALYLQLYPYSQGHFSSLRAPADMYDIPEQTPRKVTPVAFFSCDHLLQWVKIFNKPEEASKVQLRKVTYEIQTQKSRLQTN